MEGEGIEHWTLELNGIRMHVAAKGEGPVVLLLHGFPELWYSWRHQIVSPSPQISAAMATQMRRRTSLPTPSSISSETWSPSSTLSLRIRPDKVKALVNLSVVFRPRNSVIRPADFYREQYGEDHYICKFQEPEVAEAEFARTDTKLIFKRFLTYHKPAPLFLPKGKGFEESLDKDIALPSWLSEDDINYYASKFSKSGFTGGFNYYRNLNRNWELTAPWTGVQVKVPVKFIIGDLDLTYHITGTQGYIHNGGFKRDVPFLEDVVVMEGVGHFINQERSIEISDYIYEFIQKF